MNSPKEALERLASSEGFEAIGFIPECMWGKELKARIKYANAAIPVAELYEEMEKFLEEISKMSYRHTLDHIQNKVRSLLKQREALCKP